MFKFITVLFFFLSACCATSCGLALILGHGWEMALGFGLFGVGFFSVADHVKRYQ